MLALRTQGHAGAHSGGFGDGSKTAANDLVRRGFAVRFVFTGYDGAGRMTWTFFAGLPAEDSCETHLMVRIETTDAGGDVP
eukprot:880532-Prymnesium_polylepis.1